MPEITLEYIRDFRNGQTDAEIIGQAKQPGDEWFIDHHDTYAWYRAVGAAKRPKNVLELGVRYAYALIAISSGAAARRDNGYKLPRLVGVDSENDGLETNGIALENLLLNMRNAESATIIKADTRNIRDTNREILYRSYGPFDIIHIDGDHSVNGVRNELSIADTWIAKDGWILVDDIDTQHVEKAALEFCAKNSIKPVFIPTFHGMLLLPMGDSK